MYRDFEVTTNTKNNCIKDFSLTSFHRYGDNDEQRLEQYMQDLNIVEDTSTTLNTQGN